MLSLLKQKSERIFHNSLSADIINVIYTNGTKKMWNFEIAAGIQGWSKIQIYFDMYDIKTRTLNGKKVVTHITHKMYGRREGSFTVS